MSKHTPGPWVVLPEECDRPYIRIRGTVLGGRYKIANVLTPCYEGVHEREAEETRANARLIAAAPEMLEALQAIADEADGTGKPYSCDSYLPRHFIEKARAAIAKATGESK